MVAVSFYLQVLFERSLVICWVCCKTNDIFISVELKRIDFIQLSVWIHTVRLKGCFIQLFYLRVQTIILKNTAGAIGQILHIKMNELGAQAHHLVDAFNKVIGHFVTEAQSLTLMLIQCDRALSSPAAFVFL